MGIAADAENEESNANVIVSDAATQVCDRDDGQDLVPADRLYALETLPKLQAPPQVESPPQAEPPQQAEPPLEATDLPTGTQFAVQVQKQGSNRLGVRLRQTKKTLSIKRIDPGPLAEWNVSNPDKMVQVGDLVLEVNGEQAKTDIMMERMQDEMILDLIIARGSGNWVAHSKE